MFAKNRFDFIDGTLEHLKEIAWQRTDAIIKGWLTTTMEKEIRDNIKYAHTSRKIRETFWKRKCVEGIRTKTETSFNKTRKHVHRIVLHKDKRNLG